MDEYNFKIITPNLKIHGPWEVVTCYIPRKINGKWEWLIPIRRRWVEDFSFGEYTAYYQYD